MESLIYQFMAYFFPVENVPEPILAAMGFVLCFFIAYHLLNMFMSIFRRFSSGGV